MKDVTNKYINMIEAFECDFVLAKDGKERLTSLQQNIENKDKDLLEDINLLQVLSFNLRHNRAKIYELEENE